MQNFLEKNYKFIIAGIMLFMAVVSILNAKNDSLIYDEDAHIPAGYSYLKTHDMRLNPEHPPLLKDLSAFPLLFINPVFDASKDFWQKDPNTAQWEAGKIFLFGSGNNPDEIIFWSRLPIILISLILGLFIFKWAKELAGITAGLFALNLYAFDPNILGHNHYVTTDLGIAAFMFFSFYYFLRFIKYPTWKNVLLSGFFLALVQLVKFSSVMAFPVFGLVLVIYPLLGKSNFRKKIRHLGEYLGKGVIMFAFSLVLVWIAYFLNTYDMPREKLPEIINYYFHVEDTNTLNIKARQALFFLNDIPITQPLADYFFGVARVFQRVAGGNATYFLGEIDTQGFLAYFPVVFLIKEPLPSLIFFFLAMGIAFCGICKTARKFSKDISQKIFSYLKGNIVEFSMVVFIILYSFTSVTGKLNIGFRHLFPILPFAYILTAKIIFKFIKKIRHIEYRAPLNVLLFFLVSFLILDTVLAYPNYLSYFNQLAGGPKNGYRYVTDSNADWGQDLKRLKSFLEKHPEIKSIGVDYFGTADISYYLGNKYIPMWSAKRPIEPGWYAISTLFLQEGIYSQNKPNNASYRWLKNKKPRYQVGTSILIYYISDIEAEIANRLN